MSDDSEQLHQRIEALQQEVVALKQARPRGLRKRSARTVAGLPLYDIAIGPDPSKGELRGHARGVIAIGDVATGVFAMGGVAIGAIAIGGCSIGIVIGIGGVALGTLAFGGLAIGGIAFGGAAVGFAAVGGGAFGYYACGDSATGKYVVSAMQRDPEAVQFFSQWVPNFDQWM